MKFKTSFATVLLLIATSIATTATAATPATLVDAARTGDWNAVRTLVAANKSAVNTADVDGTTPLLWAIRADERDIVDVLLRAGANATTPNRLGVTPLFLAAMNGDGAMIRKLLDAAPTPIKPRRPAKPF